jgi:dTDP-4-dehydrorhamnose reductase
MVTDVLIIGGQGFVGQGIHQAALSRGYSPGIINRDNYSSFVGASPRILINANGNSKKYLSEQNPELDFKLSVESVEQSLQDFTPDLYIYLSSVDVYDHLSSPEFNSEEVQINLSKVSTYGSHKLMAESKVRDSHPHSLILRMGGFVGPGLKKNPIYDLLNGNPLYVHPDSEFQYMHTLEMGHVIFDLIEKQIVNQTFNVAGTGVVDLRSVAEWAKIDTLSLASPDVKKVRYEICTNKIQTVRAIPESRKTVQAFVKEYNSIKTG